MGSWQKGGPAIDVRNYCDRITLPAAVASGWLLAQANRSIKLLAHWMPSLGG